MEKSNKKLNNLIVNQINYALYIRKVAISIS